MREGKRFSEMIQLVLAIGLLLGGCHRPTASQTAIRLDVSQSIDTTGDSIEAVVTFFPPSPSELIVVAGGQRSTIRFDAKNPGGDQPCKVVMQAARKQSEGDDSPSLESLIRVTTPNGGYAGGPTIDKADHNQPLTEILRVSIEEGAYSVSEPISLGELNGQPISLMVRKL